MKGKLKNALLFVLVLAPIAIIGGYCTGIYSYTGYTEEARQLILEQIESPGLFYIVTAVQSAFYAVVCGFLGYLLSDKIGLMKSCNVKINAAMKAVLIGAVCGVIFSMDYWAFGQFHPELAYTYENISAANFIASILYGGIVEEVMLRLFVMSLLILILWKLFYRNKPKEKIPVGIFAAANILSALAFGALHLPATFLTFENITALVIFRCFLLNGGFGIAFGWLYRKYGIQYAMIGHIIFHVLSKAIWLILV